MASHIDNLQLMEAAYIAGMDLEAVEADIVMWQAVGQSFPALS